MFNKLQYKIVAVFVLLVTTIALVMTAFMSTNIVNFYNRDFSAAMEQIFTPSFIDSLSKTANREDGASALNTAIISHIGPLGIDSYRFYSILDAENARVIYTSDSLLSKNLEISDNIISAMSGTKGNSVNSERPYMDYAVSVGSDSTRYIVYIRDTKDELNNISSSIVVEMIRATLIALAITIILAYILGRTISSPVINLTKRAEKIAAGKFENIPSSSSNDEIGRLNNTFRYMSSALSSTINEVNSEKTKIETILKNMTDGILAFNL